MQGKLSWAQAHDYKGLWLAWAVPPPQVDLIDLQSCPDGPFKFILLHYQDHGIKLYDYRPLENKRFAAVVLALVDIFT
eukprot:5296086-Pleurochrysis_carterae.AAC.1